MCQWYYRLFDCINRGERTGGRFTGCFLIALIQFSTLMTSLFLAKGFKPHAKRQHSMIGYWPTPALVAPPDSDVICVFCLDQRQVTLISRFHTPLLPTTLPSPHSQMRCHQAMRHVNHGEMPLQRASANKSALWMLWAKVIIRIPDDSVLQALFDYTWSWALQIFHMDGQNYSQFSNTTIAS